ncbi:PAS domain-containing protein [Marinospirillum insulare]|uniref:Chemotaxis protein n=1 Tax=Marinospirillum insulare TaxID=217169 RepID=A0ABQ5ZX99_9GAMM|nr:PAS domain-containing protein [Marinospirillum insulare]GLR64806.1 chemotaxis protein [Marinospirillum insulare]
MDRGREVKLSESDIIVSKTDPKGRITYANRRFMQIAGYAEPELLGKPHNLIRHKDMPRGVFRLLWYTLQQKQEFFGYVKNLTSDGGFYWVFANITPDLRADSSLAGYFSVRRRPNYAAVKQVSEWYKKMLEIESKESASRAPEASYLWLKEKIVQQGCSYNDLLTRLEALEE